MPNLSADSLDWAIAHIIKYGDTDLFPMPFEFELLRKDWVRVRPKLQQIDYAGHVWSGTRQIIVQKDEVAFRRATQLDPIDAILFAAIMFEIGRRIEPRRVKRSLQRVFSYRFGPTKSGRLYRTSQGWQQFWTKSQELADEHEFIVVTDITDFYNQIYHHEIENQLHSVGVGNPFIKAIMNMLGSITARVSRGLPVGPHPAHLLAELALIPVDNRLIESQITYCRYVDDIHIFVKTRKDAQLALAELTNCIDEFQKLTLNRGKTKILSRAAFRRIADRMLIDDPINEAEENILEVIRDASDDPYAAISLRSIPREGMEALEDQHVLAVLRSYILESEEINFIRLRWFLRRLAQVGVPGGVEFLTDHADVLGPALPEITRYISSAKSRFTEDWPTIGEKLLTLLDDEIIETSEYMQMLITNVFSKVTQLNHIGSLTSRFSKVGEWCRREIVLAAAAAQSQAWMRRQKTKFAGSDTWMRRAILFGVQCLPPDEKDFWLRGTKRILSGIIEETIFDHVKP